MYNLAIHAPIDPSSWDDFVKNLHVNEGQESLLAGMYEQYRRDDWAYRMQHIQPLWDRSGEIGERGSYHIRPDLVAEQRAIFEERDRAYPGLVKIECAFLNNVKTILTITQADAWEVFRWRRERQRPQAASSRFPAFSFDVEDAVVRLRRDTGQANSWDSAGINKVLASWRSDAARLYSEHDVLLRKADNDALEVDAALYAAVQRQDSAASSTLQSQYNAFRAPMAKVERQIHDLNDECINRLMCCLPSLEGNSLRQEFNKQAYKPLYPDPCDLEPIFQAAEASNLSASQRAAVNDIRQWWISATDPLMKRMIERYLGWNEIMRIRQTSVFMDYERYVQKMKEDCQVRIDQSNAAIDALLNALIGTVPPGVVAAVDQWRAGMIEYLAYRQEYEERHAGWPNSYE